MQGSRDLLHNLLEKVNHDDDDDDADDYDDDDDDYMY